MSTHRIARLAGVSQTAVSLALSNSPKISRATRERVVEIARRIGYSRNAKVSELMRSVRAKQGVANSACLGVVSLYDCVRPWDEGAVHLKRIHEGMERRATELGYRLEPLWMKAPGMTYRRFRDILDARGIQGLLCFGSPDFDEQFPRELDHYAVVTQGLSIATPMHRVVSHAHNAMWHTLKTLRERGYRRPGLIVDAYEGARNSHAYLCTYLGWCELETGAGPAVPVLQLKSTEEAPIVRWLSDYKPDVAIVAHTYRSIPDFVQIVRKHRINVPDDLGVVMITQLLDGTGFSGMQGNPHLIGSRSVEMLVARISNQDFGIPAHPCIEMVDMDWVEGKSLRPGQVDGHQPELSVIHPALQTTIPYRQSA
jgi:LacI family transcriptional regulator